MVAKPKVDRKYLEESAVRQKSMVPNLIGVYVKGWQNRYGTTARPDVGGRAVGVLKRLAACWKEEKAVALIEVFCQMDDDYFVKRRHDLQTFEANLNKISLALDKGHEQTGINFSKIFGDEENGKGILSAPNGPDDENVGGKKLPAGKTSPVLEGF